MIQCAPRPTATTVVNGWSSERRELLQARLTQGSLLSPVLSFFFNADLVQRQGQQAGRSIAYVDDYTAWVTGPTSEVNHANINRAFDWERRSEVTFEADKTAIIHFSRKKTRTDNDPFLIEGEAVYPKERVKVLGLIMKWRRRRAYSGLEADLQNEDQAIDRLSHIAERYPL
ncbi:putative reverse transcriptase [Rosellinia necatrix]|uniref:Putative reverse transcriptase n=1 Tax=Rosellinia necatrix TaxID=77044 RepID=A0A1S8AAK6_ROSNE|nr:putative reverse transcriptase [Rosellinia necatrix]